MAEASEVPSRVVQELLDQLEGGIERLRVAYDKYFSGVERIAPQKLASQVDRMLRQAEATRPRQTALRFRLNALRARFVTYRHYWTRVLGQIENGTYRRHLQRLERRERALRVEAAANAKPAPDTDEEFFAALQHALQADPPGPGEAGAAAAGKPAVPPPPPTGSGARGKAEPERRGTNKPPPPPVPGMDARKIRALYEELVAAKKTAGEDVRGLTYRGLCKQLARDAPKLRKQHGKITFVVARDGGRVRLKAKVGKPG